MLWIAQGYGWHEWLRSWAQGSRCYEQLRVVDDMNDSGLSSRLKMLWITQGLDDKNNSRSRELRPLDSMNTSRLRMIWTILGRELKALDAMNSLGLWMKWITLGHELGARDGMNSLGLWITWMKMRWTIQGSSLHQQLWVMSSRL